MKRLYILGVVLGVVVTWAAFSVVAQTVAVPAAEKNQENSKPVAESAKQPASHAGMSVQEMTLTGKVVVKCAVREPPAVGAVVLVTVVIGVGMVVYGIVSAPVKSVISNTPVIGGMVTGNQTAISTGSGWIN